MSEFANYWGAITLPLLAILNRWDFLRFNCNVDTISGCLDFWGIISLLLLSI